MDRTECQCRHGRETAGRVKRAGRRFEGGVGMPRPARHPPHSSEHFDSQRAHPFPPRSDSSVSPVDRQRRRALVGTPHLPQRAPTHRHSKINNRSTNGCRECLRGPATPVGRTIPPRERNETDGSSPFSTTSRSASHRPRSHRQGRPIPRAGRRHKRRLGVGHDATPGTADEHPRPQRDVAHRSIDPGQCALRPVGMILWRSDRRVGPGDSRHRSWRESHTRMRRRSIPIAGVGRRGGTDLIGVAPPGTAGTGHRRSDHRCVSPPPFSHGVCTVAPRRSMVPTFGTIEVACRPPPTLVNE